MHYHLIHKMAQVICKYSVIIGLLGASIGSNIASAAVEGIHPVNASIRNSLSLLSIDTDTKPIRWVGLTHTVSQVRTVDINTASAQQLAQIKGIGKKTAERILAERRRAGPFSSFDDVSIRVKGMSKKKLLKLHMQGLRVGDSKVEALNSDFPKPIDNTVSSSSPKSSSYQRIRPRIAEGQILHIKSH